MIPHVIRPEIIDPDERAERGVTGRDLNGGIVSPPATSGIPPFTKQDREAVLFNLRGEAPLPYPFALNIAERYEATVVALETNRPAHDPYVTHTMPKPDMPAAQGLLPPSPSLERCPFCGEYAVILDSHDGDPQVGCQTFACRGLWKEGPIFSSHDEAMAAWNQRRVNAEIKYLVGHAAEQARLLNEQSKETDTLFQEMRVQEAVIAERGETIDQLILEGKKLGDEVQRLRKLVAEQTLYATALEVAGSMGAPSIAFTEAADTERLDWMERNHLGVEAITGDDPTGEPTRKMWGVDGVLLDKWRYTVREAIDEIRLPPPAKAAFHPST